MIPVKIYKNNAQIKIDSYTYNIPNGYNEDVYLNAFYKGPGVVKQCFTRFQRPTDIFADTSPIFPYEYFMESKKGIGIYHIVFDVSIIYNNILSKDFYFTIPDNVLKKHFNDQCVIVFDMSFDKLIPVKGLYKECDIIADCIERTLEIYNLNKDMCLILTSLFNTPDFLDIKSITCNSIILRNQNNPGESLELLQVRKEIEEFNLFKQRKYKFKFLNAKHRPHRFKLFEKFYDSNALDDNYITYHFINEKSMENTINNITSNKNLKHILPYKKNGEYILNVLNLSYAWKKSCKSDSYVEIISESNFYEEFNLLTEKTIRPIVSFTPFIFLASPNSIKILKGLGFKTFDNWWDESYDMEEDPNKRIDKVFELYEYLNNQDLHSMIIDMKDVLIHNYMHLIKYRNNNMFIQECKTYFEKLNSDK